MSQPTNRALIRWGVKTLVAMLILITGLFLAAGRLDWPAAWIYTGVLVIIQFVTAAILLNVSPELLAERAQIGEDAKKWDIVLAVLTAYGPVLILVVAGLDARNGWSPGVPAVIQVTGLVVLVLGHALTTWAMVANKFFSGVVRIQEERGHTVASSGPYRYVRHPGYVGALLFDLATPFALGTLWALVPAMLVTVVIIIRTALEDKTLQAELPGYDEYTGQTRYRLLPGVW